MRKGQCNGVDSMYHIVKIKSIIDFLEKNNYSFSFHGNECSEIKGFSTLFNYKETTITLISKMYNFEDYIHLFKGRKIRLIITDTSESIFDCFENVIQIEKPTNAFFGILDEFYSDNSIRNNSITNNINEFKKNSFISDQAVVGKNVKIGVGCVIEPDVYIGDNTEIHHNVVIKSKTTIGNNCTIYSGTIIGERGFNPLTLEDHSRKLLNHYGGVTIMDNVHIGDNCCISKGSIDDTIIGEGVKLNKQVIVAHNVKVGTDTVFTAPTFVCGSVVIGEKCHIAASVIKNQCKVGDKSILGLGSVVIKDVEAGITVVGNPAKSLEK